MDINEPIQRNKNLNIIVLSDDSEKGRIAAHQGLLLSEVFQANLTVFTNFGFQLPNGSNLINTSFVADIQNIVTSKEDSKIISDYVFPETLFKYADDHNTAVLVIGVSKTKNECFFSVKKALKLIKESRFPVMTVTSDYETAEAYKNILLPLDIERQNKEKALWAGYFCRFFNSKIHILLPEYKDEGLAKLVNDNLDFVEKLYHNLEIDYSVHHSENSSYFDEYALSFAEKFNAGAEVVMMTKYYTLADLITGPRERKIIGNSKLPILCINQRDDLYVLCT